METENLSDYTEISELIAENGGQGFDRCYQCGLCDVVCPWNLVRPFSIRKIVREATFGMTEVEEEEIWRCTTCGRCPQRCPRDVQQIESGVALRRIATEFKVFPAAVQPMRTARASLMSEGNPLGQKREDRAKWADGLSVKTFSEDMEILYFASCYLSYDPRLMSVAKATVKLLNQAGVSYGILGSKDSCCGESIRKTGDEDVFKSLAKQNIKSFIDAGVKKILVSSPHCYHTFKNEYPDFQVHFEVVHIAELLLDLVEQGRLELKGEYAKKVTYHDPCYLGRHNGIYEEPRSLLRNVPGLELSEMPDSRVDSLCCGGGGGRIWMETPKEERFSYLRMEQAEGVGAEVLATSCPYCITMFEEARLSMDPKTAPVVKDITEILQEVSKPTGM
ncbi:MAG: (Fe-S)-binding protein [Actinobacteria bacterium]|nr:(Fe-S)-binding protein [Actinomycetota bacterium]